MANLPVPLPRTFTVSEVETAAFLNSIRDALNFMLNRPSACIYQATGQSVSSGPTVAATLDATAWDTYGGHSNTTNNTRYTAQVAGTYRVTAHATWPQSSTGARQLEINKNGSIYSSGSQINSGQSSNWTAHETTVDVFLNVGDYVEMTVQQMSGGSLTLLVGATPYQTYMIVDWVKT